MTDREDNEPAVHSLIYINDLEDENSPRQQRETVKDEITEFPDELGEAARAIDIKNRPESENANTRPTSAHSRPASVRPASARLTSSRPRSAKPASVRPASARPAVQEELGGKEIAEKEGKSSSRGSLKSTSQPFLLSGGYSKYERTSLQRRV